MSNYISRQTAVSKFTIMYIFIPFSSICALYSFVYWITLCLSLCSATVNTPWAFSRFRLTFCHPWAKLVSQPFLMTTQYSLKMSRMFYYSVCARIIWRKVYPFQELVVVSVVCFNCSACLFSAKAQNIFLGVVISLHPSTAAVLMLFRQYNDSMWWDERLINYHRWHSRLCQTKLRQLFVFGFLDVYLVI